MKKPEPFKKRYTTRRVVIPKDGIIIDGLPASVDFRKMTSFNSESDKERGEYIRGRAL